jgi:hypothetical protein
MDYRIVTMQIYNLWNVWKILIRLLFLTAELDALVRNSGRGPSADLKRRRRFQDDEARRIIQDAECAQRAERPRCRGGVRSVIGLRDAPMALVGAGGAALQFSITKLRPYRDAGLNVPFGAIKGTTVCRCLADLSIPRCAWGVQGDHILATTLRFGAAESRGESRVCAIQKLNLAPI